MSQSSNHTKEQQAEQAPQQLAELGDKMADEIINLRAENLKLKAQLESARSIQSNPPATHLPSVTPATTQVRDFQGRKPNVVHVVDHGDEIDSTDLGLIESRTSEPSEQKVDPKTKPLEQDQAWLPVEAGTPSEAVPVPLLEEPVERASTDILLRQESNVSDDVRLTLADELALQTSSESDHRQIYSETGVLLESHHTLRAKLRHQKWWPSAKLKRYIRIAFTTFLAIYIGQTYVACRRERGRWLEANNMSRTYLFGILHYDASLFVAPGVNPDFALGIQDLRDFATVAQVVFWSYMTSIMPFLDAHV